MSRFVFDFVSLFSSCYHVTILKCFCKALFNEFFQGMRYTVTVRAFFVHTCSRFCRHFAFESRRISSCRRFLTDSKLISEDMQSILHLWQTVRYLSGHLCSLLLAVRNCSVPSQLRQFFVLNRNGGFLLCVQQQLTKQKDFTSDEP